jgi:hypothetical protein
MLPRKDRSSKGTLANTTCASLDDYTRAEVSEPQASELDIARPIRLPLPIGKD